MFAAKLKKNVYEEGPKWKESLGINILWRKAIC